MIDFQAIRTATRSASETVALKNSLVASIQVLYGLPFGGLERLKVVSAVTLRRRP